MSILLKEVVTTIETERLLLRMPQIGDGEVVNRAIVTSHCDFS